MKKVYSILCVLLPVMLYAQTDTEKGPGDFSFTHILFEFSSIVCAVFLGISIDRVRQSIRNRKTEVKYIQSLLRDLREDVKILDKTITLRQEKSKSADTAIQRLKEQEPGKDSGDIYFHLRFSSRRAFISSANITIEQLKNAGELHLIRNLDIVNCLVKYELKIRDIQQLQNVEENILWDFRRSTSHILDPLVLEEMVTGFEVKHPQKTTNLMTDDSTLINQVCINLHYLNSANNRLILYLDELKAQCSELITAIQKRYSIKDIPT